MAISNLQYFWDGKRVFVRYFVGSDQSGDQPDLPVPTRYALFAEVAALQAPPSANAQDPTHELILIGQFDFRPDVPFTYAFIPPVSATRLRLGRVDAMGWKKDELLIELNPTLLPDNDIVHVQPFAIRFEEGNSRIYADRANEYEAPAKDLKDVLSREEAAIGNRLVVAQIYYRRTDQKTTTSPKVTIGKLQVKRTKLDNMVRVSAKRDSVAPTTPLTPGLTQVERSILLDSVDQISLRISIPGREQQQDSTDLQKLLEQVYLIHIPLQIQLHHKNYSDHETSMLPPPMTLPDSILASWGALRIPSERAQYNIECLTDAYRNEGGNSSGIIATRNSASYAAAVDRRNVFSVNFVQAAVCDIVGVVFAAGSTFSIVEDANSSSPREIAKRRQSFFFRVLDGRTAKDEEITPHLKEIDMEVRRRFRAESDAFTGTREQIDRTHALMQLWIDALEPMTGLDQSAVAHPLDAEAFADAVASANPNAILRRWPVDSQVELFFSAPSIFEIALRNDSLAEKLTSKMVTLRRSFAGTQSIAASLMLVCDIPDIPSFTDPNQQIVAWDLASNFELFERLCAVGISPFADATISDLQPRLESLWNDGRPLGDWVSYAESPDASLPRNNIKELRTLFDRYQKPLDERGWLPLTDALKFADLLTMARQAFVKQTGLPAIRGTAAKRLDQMELIEKIRELLRFVDGNTSVGLDISYVKKRIEEAPVPPILLLEDWHTKLKTVLGSSEIDRRSDDLVRRLGEWAGLGDATAKLCDLETPIKERRDGLSEFLRRASVFQVPLIDTIRASDRLGSARVNLHSKLRAMLTANLRDNIHAGQDMPELYRFADMLLYHRVFTAINTLLTHADHSAVPKKELSKTIRHLALWPQRAETTIGLALSIESSNGSAGGNVVSDSLSGLDVFEAN